MITGSSMQMSDVMLTWARLDGRSGHDAALGLLAEAYRKKTGQNCPEICIADRGKPYFSDGSMQFSISHTRNHAFCVISRGPVGIDAEEMDREINLKLADKILSETEMARFDGTRQSLLKFWVLKEASVKLTGEGLRGFPNHTDFSPDDPRIAEIDGCYVAVLEG